MPTRFYKSRISWNGNGWDFKLKDGTTLIFSDAELAVTPGQAALVGIRDRHANRLTLTRSGEQLTSIVSPNGFVRLTYAKRWLRTDSSGC